jgi:hypothetical protein
VKVQDTGEARSYALVSALNAMVRAYVDNDTTLAHYEKTSTPAGDYRNPSISALLMTFSTPPADLAAARTAANEARRVLYAHMVDANAHKAADTVNAALISTTALAELTSSSSQGDTNTFINTLKTAYQAHRTQANIHSHNDTTNVITDADATDLATSKTLVAGVKTQGNAHVNLSYSGVSVEL